MEASFARIEKLLALILVEEMDKASVGQRALALARAGFKPVEIGEILGERGNTISVQLLRAKRAGRRRPTRKKA